MGSYVADEKFASRIEDMMVKSRVFQTPDRSATFKGSKQDGTLDPAGLQSRLPESKSAIEGLEPSYEEWRPPLRSPINQPPQFLENLTPHSLDFERSESISSR